MTTRSARILLATLSLLVATPATAETAHVKGRGDAYPLTVGDHGPRCRDFQWLYSGHNRFKVKTYYSPIDTVCGEKTAVATRRMKYLLGWPQPLVNRVADRNLRAILVGDAKRPKAYVQRSMKRLDERRRLDALLNRHGFYPIGGRPIVCGVPGVGTHSYRARPHNWQSDRAVDLCTRAGTPVYAVRSGYICPGCGFGVSGGTSSRFGGARLTLVAWGSGQRFYYAHLLRYALWIRPGARVVAGQKLGDSGVANGVAHIHWACQSCDVLDTIKRARRPL